MNKHNTNNSFDIGLNRIVNTTH